jgi:hypothetical protein
LRAGARQHRPSEARGSRACFDFESGVAGEVRVNRSQVEQQKVPEVAKLTTPPALCPKDLSSAAIITREIECLSCVKAVLKTANRTLSCPVWHPANRSKFDPVK